MKTTFRFSHVVPTRHGLQVVFTATYGAVTHWHTVTAPWRFLAHDICRREIIHAWRVADREPEPDDQPELPW